MIDCNEWRTEKRQECANMGKVKLLELWRQLYRTSLPVWDLENFRPMDFCWHECTSLPCTFNVTTKPRPYSWKFCQVWPIMIPNPVRDTDTHTHTHTHSTHSLFDLLSTSNIHHNTKISSPANCCDNWGNFNANQAHARTLRAGLFRKPNLNWTRNSD